MAKWVGEIGFSKTQETAPGIWEESIIRKKYVGDILSNRIKNQSSGNINDDVVLSNKISIIFDPFAMENLGHIKYLTVSGTKWKVSDIEVQYPRLYLTTGGLYND